MIDKRDSLGRAVADAFVLHEDDPALAACPSEPVDIGHVLIGRNAVHLREGLQAQPLGTEKIGYLPPAEAAIKEQRGQAVWMPGRHVKPQAG
ncbi:hypothetical protein JOF56_003419 [Kibdelosporangium banguiense]|uniref:Uncharacterized protein n=1 Tax=Kibdelosporangium banguiense TaxID=1365924 RepID=A0ABS4TGB6_9PSEU|nr:hypothetical protein [Kibdelosporangium banguiense]MBP2323034.1 hypothetical protein [Kibdelosporangium banguiense]